MTVLPSAPECVFSGRRCDLDIIVERVEQIAVAGAPGYWRTLRLQSTEYLRVVPIGNRVADVVDHGLGRRLGFGGGIAHHDIRAALARLRAEHQVRPLFSLPARCDLHAEHRGIPIARLD